MLKGKRTALTQTPSTELNLCPFGLKLRLTALKPSTELTPCLSGLPALNDKTLLLTLQLIKANVGVGSTVGVSTRFGDCHDPCR